MLIKISKCLFLLRRMVILYPALLSAALISLFFWSAEGYAQTTNEIKHAKKLFAGAWLNKKSTRHLLIFIEKDGYVTINDWTSNVQKRESGDAYKAIIRKDKLIMPEDRDHHSDYSEIFIQDNKLIYMTRNKMPDNKIIVEKQIFLRTLM